MALSRNLLGIWADSIPERARVPARLGTGDTPEELPQAFSIKKPTVLTHSGLETVIQGLSSFLKQFSQLLFEVSHFGAGQLEEIN